MVGRRAFAAIGCFLLLWAGVVFLPQAVGAVAEDAPAYVPQQFLIKFTPAVSACAHCLIDQGLPFATVTGSDALDELNRRFQVVSARSVFIERHDLTAQQAQTSWQRHVEAVRARFARRSARAPTPDAPIPDLTNVYLFTVNSTEDVQTICQAYAQNPVVEYCEPNYLFRAALVPNDPFWPAVGSWGQSFDDLWGLKQIQADLAWDLTQGSGALVAVTDTGFDFTHPDRGATWINPGEISGNGLDDDGNGLVDDVRGWDFVSGDNDPTDNNGHGTHVTGIINAALNNNTGIVGVAPASTAMVLKTQGATGSGTLTALAQAVNYASAKGADVVNMSLSTSPIATPLTLRDAIDLAHDTLGLVLVASAGNSHRLDVGTEAFGIFPAAFNDVITVSANLNATFLTTQIALFSNIGAKIDVAAPGSGPDDDPPSASEPFRAVLSLGAAGATAAFTGSGQLLVAPPSGTGSYIRQAGTSQAAPFVAGTAALILSQQPALTNEQVRQVLRNSATDIERPDRDRTSGYGRLNALQALQLGSIPIARLSNPTLFSKVKQGVPVEIVGTATSPAVAFGTWQVSFKRLEDAAFTLIASGTTPVADGLLTTWDTSGLVIGQQYVVKLEAQDANGAIATDRVVVYVRTPQERFTVQQVTSTALPRNSIMGKINADGTRVAFYSSADLVPGSNPGGFQTFLWNATTGQFTQITFGSGSSLPTGPSISADGTQIAFTSYQNLVGANADRNEEVFFFDQALAPPGIKQLTQTTFHNATPTPSLSGDGRWVAIPIDADFVGQNADLSIEIFRVDTVTEAKEQLTSSPSPTQNFHPSLNADGMKLAFGSDRFSPGDIFLLEITSNTLRRITNSGGNSSILPSLNSDGSLIAFNSGASLIPGGNDGNWEVFLADTNTNALVQVTNSPRNLPIDSVHSFVTAISRDGNRLAIFSTADLDPSIGNPFASKINSDSGEQIFLYDVPTNRTYQVTDALRRFETLSTETPSVNEDGTRIAFHSPGELDPNTGASADNPDSNVELFLAMTADRPPVLDPIGPRRIGAEQPFTLTVNGSDLDLNPLTFSASNLPTGASFTPATRTFSWTPTADQISATPYFVRFVVDDGTFGDMEEVPITVVAPPVLAPIGPKTINEGQLLSFSVSATDSDAAATLTLSAANLPAGASFPTVNGTGSVSGTFNWTPGFDQAGSYQVTFTATDQGGVSDSEAITITVNNVNQAPTITTGNQDMHEQTDLTFALSCGGLPCNFFEVVASDPDGDPVSLSMVTWPPPPPGSSFDSVSRRFTWTNPSFASLRRCHASYSATFQATDGLGGWAQKTLTITWKRCGAGSAFCASPINHPPVVLAVSRSDGGWGGIDTPFGTTSGWMYGQVYAGNTFTLLSRQFLLTSDRDFYPTCDPDGDALSAYAWSYLGSSPAGITQEQLALSGLNQHTAVGTASAAVGTTLNFRLQVQDSQGGSGSADTSVAIIQRPCFIATAAYGSPMAPELDILRTYRDEVLSRSWLGRTFTELYYRTSPPVARFLADKPLLRALVRGVLKPLVGWAKRRLALAE